MRKALVVLLLATVAHADAPAGSGYGVGSDGKKAPASMRPQVRTGLPIVKGDLDTTTIRRYIRRNIQKIVYCYEKQLLVDGKLAGKMTTDFTINPDGQVTAATATGLDKTVAACVQSVLARIQFPNPKRGEVVVTYPFTFAPPAGDKSKTKKPAKK